MSLLSIERKINVLSFLEFYENKDVFVEVMVCEQTNHFMEV